MAERRRHRRIAKRMQVEFGVDALDQRGVVVDVSLGGMYIECRRPPDIGTRLHLHVLHHERDFYVEGVVARLRLVEPKLRRIESEGMGVRFLTPDELVAQTIPKAQRKVEAGTIRLANDRDVEKLLDEQLAARILLVPVESPWPELGTVVEFRVRAEYAPAEPYQGRGRLVQLLGPATGPTRQAVVEVHDVDDLREWLRDPT